LDALGFVNIVDFKQESNTTPLALEGVFDAGASNDGKFYYYATKTNVCVYNIKVEKPVFF